MFIVAKIYNFNENDLGGSSRPSGGIERDRKRKRQREREGKEGRKERESEREEERRTNLSPLRVSPEKHPDPKRTVTRRCVDGIPAHGGNESPH